MKPSSNPPNSSPERSYSKVDLFLNKIRRGEDEDSDERIAGEERIAILRQVAESDPNDIDRMAQLRMLHGETASKFAYSLHELSQELGCAYSALQRAVLLKLDQTALESDASVDLPVQSGELPVDADENRERIVFALNKEISIEEDRDSSQRETAEWRPDCHLIPTSEMGSSEQVEIREVPISPPVDMLSIWTKTPSQDMGIAELVGNLTPEGQGILDDLIRLEDIRDGEALAQLEKERGKKGHVMLAFHIVDRMNYDPGALRHFELALASARGNCLVMGEHDPEAAPFSGSAGNEVISSPWIKPPQAVEQASLDPLGDFLRSLSDEDRYKLERDMQNAGKPGEHPQHQWSAVGSQVLKKMAGGEPAFRDPNLIRGRLEAMRIAMQAANSPDYKNTAAFVAANPQRSDSPWAQHAATRSENVEPEDQPAGEAVKKAAETPVPPALPKVRGMLKSTNRFDNAAGSVDAHAPVHQLKESIPFRKTDCVIEWAESGCTENQFVDELKKDELVALRAYKALDDRNDMKKVNKLSGEHGRVFWAVARAIDIRAERRKVSLDEMLKILGIRLGGGSIVEDHFTPKIVVKSQSDKPKTEEEIRQRQASTVISASTKVRQGKKPDGLFGRALFGNKKND